LRSFPLKIERAGSGPQKILSPFLSFRPPMRRYDNDRNDFLTAKGFGPGQ
jgi:hypothetical protein